MNWAAQQFVPTVQQELMDAYSDWVGSHMDDGWEPSCFVSFLDLRQLKLG